MHYCKNALNRVRWALRERKRGWERGGIKREPEGGAYRTYYWFKDNYLSSVKIFSKTFEGNQKCPCNNITNKIHQLSISVKYKLKKHIFTDHQALYQTNLEFSLSPPPQITSWNYRPPPPAAAGFTRYKHRACSPAPVS